MNPTHGRVRRSVLGALIAGATVVLAACGPGGGGGGGGVSVSLLSDYKATQGVKGGKLTYADWQKLDNLFGYGNPSTVLFEGTSVLWAYTWTFDPQGKAVPDIVKEIPSTDNGDVKKIDDTHMDMTLNLKSGLNWSDGQPLTADDLKYTIDTICNPASGYSGGTVGFDHIASMEVKSPTQLVMHFGPDPTGKRCGLSAPLTTGIFAPYVGVLNFQPMPMHRLQGSDVANWATNDYFTTKTDVVSGPYMVKNFSPGSSATLIMVPNPHYHDGRTGGAFFADGPYLDQLTFKIYGSAPAMIAGLAAGEADIALNLTVSDTPALSSISTRKTIIVTGLQSEFLTLNEGNNTKGCDATKFAATCGKPTPWQNDPKLRQAMNMSLDKAAINQSRNLGKGGVMNTAFFPGFGTSWYDTSKENFTRDVAGANSLLDGDGWTKGSDGIRTKNGKRLQFTVTTTGGNPSRVAMEQIMIKNWKDIGADVSQDNCSTNCFGGFADGGNFATGQYDISLFANNWGPDPDSICTEIQSNQIPTAAAPAGQNWGRIKNDAYDKACLDEEGTLDLAGRVAAFKRMQDAMLSDFSIIGLEARPDVNAYAPYVGNYAINPGSATSSWNAADWFHTAS
jgi:peptide/nickel transport system substrate-binding protein